MYLTYIRPLLEYACEVWDGCGEINSAKLEKIQLDAARIVTGLPIYTKKEYIYSELNWPLLRKRRENRKLQLFYNIINNKAPTFLKEFIPDTRANSLMSNLRNANRITQPYNRLQLSSNSYFPTTIN